MGSGRFAGREFIFSSGFPPWQKTTKVPWYSQCQRSYIKTDLPLFTLIRIPTPLLRITTTTMIFQSCFVAQTAYQKCMVCLKNGCLCSLCSSFKFMAITHHHLRVLTAQYILKGEQILLALNTTHSSQKVPVLANTNQFFPYPPLLCACKSRGPSTSQLKRGN